jgi:hypothetical protein
MSKIANFFRSLFGSRTPRVVPFDRYYRHEKYDC